MAAPTLDDFGPSFEFDESALAEQLDASVQFDDPDLLPGGVTPEFEDVSIRAFSTDTGVVFDAVSTTTDGGIPVVFSGGQIFYYGFPLGVYTTGTEFNAELSFGGNFTDDRKREAIDGIVQSLTIDGQLESAANPTCRWL